MINFANFSVNFNGDVGDVGIIIIIVIIVNVVGGVNLDLIAIIII